MPLKEFSSNDIFKNTLVTFPRFEFKIYQGKAYLNNSFESYEQYENLNLKAEPAVVTPNENSLIFNLAENSQYIPLI